MRLTRFAGACLLIWWLPCRLLAGSEAFEVDLNNTVHLPRGKEADGIVGDLVMRNDRVELLISHNAPLRRANMSTFYGPDGITPGCLYDLGLRGASNDEIVIFAALSQRGPVSHVRLVRDGREGVAEVETWVARPRNRGVSKRHSYRLADGDQGVLIGSILRNKGNEAREGALDDGFEPNGDTLGFDLRAGNISVEEAKAILSAAGR